MSMDVAPNSASPSYTPTDGGAREGEATETMSPLESPRLGSISPRGGQSPRKMGSVLTTSERLIMESFQTLDYDVCQNVLYREREMSYTQRDRFQRELAYWTIYSLIGIGTGLAAFFILVGVETLLDIRFGIVLKLMAERSVFAAWLANVTLCMAFVGVATSLVVFVEPAASGSGIPDLKAYLNGTNIRRLVTFKALICKVVGVVFSVGGGLCVGKEGPLVHTGSILAANISHGWKACSVKHWQSFRNDCDKRNFVSCGCAAGVAAAFGAPIGGVLFSLEEASSFWSMELTSRAFFCAIVGTATINLLIIPFHGHFEPLLAFGAFPSNPYALWEIPIFACMAVFGGVAGGLFNSLNEQLTLWRRESMRGRKWWNVLEALIVAFVTGTTFFWLPYIFSGNCFPIPDVVPQNVDVATRHVALAQANGVDASLYQAYMCPPGQYNDMASLSLTGQEKTIFAFFHNYESDDRFVFSTSVCCTYFVVYSALAVWTYGIMVPSGLFVPGIICGCVFGRLTGEWVKHLTYEGDWTTHAVHPGIYALLGAACMLGGMSRMTISMSIILVETTGHIQYLFPIMICLMISKSIGDRFNISLYDLHVKLKCIPFVEGEPPPDMIRKTAIDVASREVECLGLVCPVEEVYTLLRKTRHCGFPVRTPNDQLSGIILRSQLIVLLKKQDVRPPPPPPPWLAVTDWPSWLAGPSFLLLLLVVGIDDMLLLLLLCLQCWVAEEGFDEPPDTDAPLEAHYGISVDDFATKLQSDSADAGANRCATNAAAPFPTTSPRLPCQQCCPPHSSCGVQLLNLPPQLLSAAVVLVVAESRWVSCPVLSCLVLSCLVLSCLVLSCLVLSCLVLSCLVLSDAQSR
jgi:chloride channel 7